MSNLQLQRLEHYRHEMLQHQNCVVLHSTCFRSITGTNIILGGPRKSGKTHLLNVLEGKGLVDELYDEDLIVLSTTGELRPLGQMTYRGKQDGIYQYATEHRQSFGSVDMMIGLSSRIVGLIQTTAETLIKDCLIHEVYHGDPALIAHYYRFVMECAVPARIFGNMQDTTDFTDLIDLVGSK